MMNNSTSSIAVELPPLPPLPINLEDVRESHGFSDTAHWVIPNVLMQGDRPGLVISEDESDNDDAFLDQVREIVEDGGCRTFVCAQAECAPEEGSILLDDDGGTRKPNPKDLPTYAKHVLSSVTKDNERLLGEKEGRLAKPAVFLYYGIIGMETARSVDSLSNAVSDLADRIRSGGETIYIHCGGGVGRAGLLAACLLGELYQDLDADMAMEYTTQLCYLRNNDDDDDVVEEGGRVVSHHYSSPETDGQKEQVREFFKKIRAK